MKFVDNSLEIFKILEPELVKIAIRQNTQDSIGEARSWYLRYYEILTGFDSQKYKKSFTNRLGEAACLNTEQSVLEQPKYLAGLLAYMKKAFKWDLVKARQRNSIALDRLDQINDMFNPEKNNQFKQFFAFDESEIIRITDLLHLIEKDISKFSKLATNIRDDINVLFTRGLYLCFKDQHLDFGDFPIVSNYNASSACDFFVKDLVEGRYDKLVIKMRQLLEQEPNTILSMACASLLDEKTGKQALNKKISRYLVSYQGGMPKRLKELKHKVDAEQHRPTML